LEGGGGGGGGGGEEELKGQGAMVRVGGREAAVLHKCNSVFNVGVGFSEASEGQLML